MAPFLELMSILVYYRATLHFSGIPYTSDLAQKDSDRFGQLQEDIIASLEDLYFNIPGDQFVTVVQFKWVTLNAPIIDSKLFSDYFPKIFTPKLMPTAI